jgi:UDP-N-acetyl-2-amino-2-deoxyglucuronate dehydrogenase
MARTYGFGVVGLGMGKSHCRRLAVEKRARLVAVCDIDPARGQAVQSEFKVPWYRDYRELLNDPAVDVVVVATPTGMHAQFAIRAARAGKHVLCEKPIDIDPGRARRIIRVCRREGVKLQVGFQNRCTRDAMRTRSDIASGRIGRLLFGEMQLRWWRGAPGYFAKGGWRGTWKYDGGGAFMNQGVHYVDLLVWFMGEPVSVVGRCRTTLFPIETEDVGMAIVRFDGGAQASLLATTTAHPIKADSTRIHLQGSDGRITMTGSYALERTKIHLAKGRRAGAPPRATTLYSDLVRAIETDTEPISSGEQALRSLAVIKAIYRSSQTGREVRIRVHQEESCNRATS